MKLLEELHAQSGGGRSGGAVGGRRKIINSELWHACAGPLVSLPQPGSLVYYFPQGHTEQVSTTTKRVADAHIPCYPNLSSQMMCQVHKVTLHADKDTDEIYAQITLQPVNSENDVFLIPDFGQSNSKQPKEFFCKTLTASDTSTHGGFSVPRRAAEKLFPPLDFSMQPPNQELVVKDLHDNTWTFRHIYRGQPKRNLLTTGWSVFVGSKRLKAGDSVIFIRDESSQLLLGVRRANRQQALLPSSVLSADSMHIGVLAAAAHASANRTPFTIYYNPRACSSEFVVPLAKYHRAVYGTRISLGTRFGMMFEAEDSSKRRYMGTIMGISDHDPLRWPNSKWRNLQVDWDECGCIERPSRVSLWEIEPPENLFIFSSPTSVLKRPCSSDLPEGKSVMKRSLQHIPVSDSMNVLLKSQTPNPGIQVGCYPSAYPPLVQNLTKYELPSTSTVMGCPHQGNQLLNDILSQTESQKESTPFTPQQVATSGCCLLEENSSLSNCQTNVSDVNSQVLLRPQDVTSDSSLEPSCDGQDGCFDSKHNSSNGEGKVVDTEKDHANIASVEALIGMDENEIELPASFLESQYEDKGKGKRQNCSAITDPSLLLERGFPTQVQKVEPNVFQIPREDAPLLDITDPIFPLHDKHHQSPPHNFYMDNLGWMLNSSHDQLFTREEQTQPESLSSFGKVDMTSFYGSDNSRTTSADISAIINPEHISSTCTSEVSADQGLLGFAQDSSSNEMPHHLNIPSHLEGKSPNMMEQCAPRLASSSAHSVPIKGSLHACGFPHPYELKGLLEFSDAPNQSLSKLPFQVGNGNILPKKTNADKTEDGFDVFGNSNLHATPKGLACNFSSCQDVESQVNSGLMDFSQEPPDNSRGTSLSNMDAGENSQLNKYSWKQVSPPLRTYAKVQKLGSVGRCIDVTQFRNYGELISSIACMFGLEDQLNDSRCSDWKLVYVDYENDVLLVGDDPWEEFVNCVRCIRILSPTEVQQMSQEGLPIIDEQLVNEAKDCPIEQNQFVDEDYMLCRGSV